MGLKLRKKMVLVALALYWPTLFVLSHIPMPRVMYEARISDKTLHFIAYFILVFLFWGSVSPYERVHWRKVKVWWVLVAVVWYGAIDEWLQGFVQGRTVDIRDFYTDLLATVASLVLLSVLSFWPALLWVTGGSILILSICAQAKMQQYMPHAYLGFQVGAYTFFTAQWILFIAKRHRDRWDTSSSILRFIGPVRSTSTLSWWWVQAPALPLALWMIVALIAWGNGQTLHHIEATAGLFAIGGSVTTVGVWRSVTSLGLKLQDVRTR
jgi:VanZ family protein